MNPETTNQEKEDLATRTVSKPWFGILWIIIMTTLVAKLWWVRDVALVWLVYSRDAYFRDGLRVLPGKPVTFTNGVRAPSGPDALTGFAFFLVVVLGSTLLIVFALKLYERLRVSRKTT